MAIRTRWQSIVVAALLLWGAMAPAAGTHSVAGRQWVVAHFEDPTLVWTDILEGSYLIVHDDTRAFGGEACTSIYKLDGSGRAQEETVSFHCIPYRRPVLNHDKVTTMWDPALGMHKMTEFQFAREGEGHGVPSCQNAANGLRSGVLVFGP